MTGVAKVVFLIQMLLTFGGRCNRYFWDIRLNILRSLNFNMLFQLVLTKVFKSELFSSLSKVGHVIKSCKEPITLVTSDDSDVSAMLTLQRIAFRADTKRYPCYAPLSMWTVHFGNRRGNHCVTEIALKSLFLGTDRLLPSGGGGGILKMHKMWGGSKY